jgi:hypothetical protein
MADVPSGPNLTPPHEIKNYPYASLLIIIYSRIQVNRGGSGLIGDYVGFEVFTAVVMKSIVFWDMTPCSPLNAGGKQSSAHAGFLFDLFLDPEDGGDMFLRNIG